MNSHICLTKSRGENPAEPDWHDGEECPFSTAAEIRIGGKNQGHGQFFVTSERLVFVPSSVDDSCVFFGYRSMALHAISSVEGKKCIFIQLVGNEEEDIDGDEGEGEGAQSTMNDIIEIVPQDESVIQEFFDSMNEMSALHPDDDEDDDDSEEYEDIPDDSAAPTLAFE